MNPMFDTDFLKQLYKNHDKELFAKIIALNNNEEPIEEIQGKITTGSINVDGASAVRRTCSLTLVAYDIKVTDYYWGVKTKFTLSIGLKNNINSKYPDIIWFPQGVYIITSFNSSQSTNAFTISLSGKDKMCLLNGDISGNIHANSTRFDIIESYDEVTNTRTETKLLIKDIIREAVHAHGGEPMHNIIVNDLDDYGIEMLEYRGSSPMYVSFDIEKNKPDNIFFDTEKTVEEGFIFKNLTTNEGEYSDNRPELSLYQETNHLGKIEFGEAAGYRLTDLVYPGELLVNSGETLTSVLDKIKNILTDFEYFYDINGRFIFQKKKNYVNTSWNNLRTGSDGVVYAEAAAYESNISWSFEGNEMLASASNNPSLNNLKNDFSIWGSRKSISGAEIPIHLRYAIDKKPTSFKNYEGNLFTATKYDYRELIYQMALDYRLHNREDNFISKLIENNPELCAKGCTGYEQYYTDMEGFWRQIYNPNPSSDEAEEYDVDYWHKNVRENPSVLNFWFELLDTEGEISQFSIPAIGDRSKVVKNNAIKSVYFKDTPLIIFYESPDDRLKKTGYTYSQMTTGIDNLFSPSAQGKSAKEELDTLLYNHTYCANTISLNSIPIYTLQPNSIISIKDDENIGINGKYVVSKLTIPLSYNGMMSISASLLPQRIY